MECKLKLKKDNNMNIFLCVFMLRGGHSRYYIQLEEKDGIILKRMPLPLFLR